MKIEFDQVIALVIIVGTLGLLFTGIDSEVKAVLLLAAGWAFGSGYQQRHQEKHRGPSD